VPKWNKVVKGQAVALAARRGLAYAGIRRATMLRQKLTDDMKTAMKAGEKERLGTIRLIISEIKAADVKTPGTPELDDAGIAALMGRMLKQRRDSVEQFTKGGRADLAAKELGEIGVIEAYLPKQMDDAQVRVAITGLIAELGAAGPKDMGKVMGALKAKYAGQMDFAKANGVVKDLLKS
jgi:uncharacterized protein YqeY